MSRRDTIIIAVLLNAGLLIVLFATSLKFDKDKETQTIVQTIASNGVPVQNVSGSKAPILKETVNPTKSDDSIDDVIKQYVKPEVKAVGSDGHHVLQNLHVTGPKEHTGVMSSNPHKFFKEITIQPGDTLGKIARQHRVSDVDLIEINELSSSQVHVGQVIKVPCEKLEKLELSQQTEFYTIKPGDSPWSIATAHRMKVGDLLKMNDLDEAKARQLKPGQKLRIK